MSRVLKFRIWDKANEEYMILGATGLDARNGDVIDYYNEGNRLGGPEEYDVEQYTGSTDKNSKEIYEGDILDTPGGRCLCVWSDDGWAYQFKVHRTDWFDIVKEFHKNSEVIGNIHENKELWGESV